MNCAYCGADCKNNAICSTCIAILDAAHEKLKPFAGMKPINPTDANRVVNRVAAYFKISRERIFSPVRDSPTAFARHVAMRILRYGGIRYKDIGDLFSRDHSTVIHGCNLINARISQDVRVAKLVMGLMKS